MPTHHRVSSRRLGALPARYSFVLNPYSGERFTKCPSCDAPTRVRKLPLVVHIDHLDGPRLILLNKRAASASCARRSSSIELNWNASSSRPVSPNGGKVPVFVVLGTIDRRTWRRGLAGDAQLADIREHMADFKRYLRVDVTPAHWELSNRDAGQPSIGADAF
jgi:hypothetical protein